MRISESPRNSFVCTRAKDTISSQCFTLFGEFAEFPSEILSLLGSYLGCLGKETNSFKKTETGIVLFGDLLQEER